MGDKQKHCNLFPECCPECTQEHDLWKPCLAYREYGLECVLPEGHDGPHTDTVPFFPD